MNTHAAARWYREPYVWLIIAIPASAVVVGAIMLTLAINTDDGLVVDDYYKQGLEINRTLGRDRLATSHGLGAQIDFSVATQNARVTLTADPGFAYPDQMTLGLYHATRGDFDATTKLRQTGRRTYVGEFGELRPGRWYIHLETDLWRLTGVMTWPRQSVTLSAAPRD